MTFGNARDDLRNRKLAETSTQFYSDVELLGMLVDASIEVASALSFPQKRVTSAVAAAATSLASPAGLLNAQLGQVTYNGLRMRPADYATVLYYQQNGGIPTVYNFDPRTTDGLIFGPAVPTGGGTLGVEYIESLYNSGAVTDASTIWGTTHDGTDYGTPLFPQFHDIVGLRASVKAFQMSMEMDKSSYYTAQYDRRFREFAAFLGFTDLGKMATPNEARGERELA